MAELDDRKAALVAELSRARANLSRHADGMRGKSDFSGRVKSGFNENRFAWMGGAAIVGLALAKLPPRTKKVPLNPKDREKLARLQGSGMVVGGIKLALDFAKPLLLAWATKRMGDVARSSEKVERKVDRVEKKSDDIHAATT